MRRFTPKGKFALLLWALGAPVVREKEKGFIHKERERKGADNPRYLLKKGRLGGSVTELEPIKRIPCLVLQLKKEDEELGAQFLMPIRGIRPYPQGVQAQAETRLPFLD
ncbi:hypothetical protein GBA52_006904 [Prunus armeniaca]|nr:hypothetical protein GBA52_006904 [Prunus armeniaca]